MTKDDAMNPVRACAWPEAAVAQGQALDAALRQASWRVFGLRPGGHGARLQELIASGRWKERADLGAAYLRAGSFAYGADGHGVAARAALSSACPACRPCCTTRTTASTTSRFHDYYQFHGGMGVAVGGLDRPAARALPRRPERARRAAIRPFERESWRVVRARVNPKWLDGVKRHGYKGAFEIAATVDYLFAFDATSGVVADHQYAPRRSPAPICTTDTRDFLQQHT